MTTYVDLEKTLEELIVHYDKVRWQSNGSFDDFIRAFRPSDDCLLKASEDVHEIVDALLRIPMFYLNGFTWMNSGKSDKWAMNAADLILALSAEKEKAEARVRELEAQRVSTQ